MVLSGPAAQRGPLLAALRRVGANLSDGQPVGNRSYGLPADLYDDWVTVRHRHLDPVLEQAGRVGWRLRLHWQTPLCGYCAGNGQVTVGVDGLGPCRHCGGCGRTNRPAPAGADLLKAELEALRSEVAALREVLR